MNAADFQRIESELGITLPQSYRHILEARSEQLADCPFEFNGENRQWFDRQFYLTAQETIDTNLWERERDSGTGYAFPYWWKTFFLFGDNEGGDYYCLRLDGDPRVWMIGADGGEPWLAHESIEDYVDECLRHYKEELLREPEPTPPPKPTFYEAFTPQEREEYEARVFNVPESEKPFLFRIIQSPEDDAPRLEFADWLTENGAAQRAKYIRGRCQLDRKAPDPADYVDLMEQAVEGQPAAMRTDFEMPPGFYLHHSEDRFERGFPGIVEIEHESNDDAESTAKAIERLPELIQTTPVRGIGFEWKLPEHVGAILQSESGKHLTWLKFDTRPNEGKQCPVIAAIASSPVAPELRRLEFGRRLYSDGDASVLAAAPFSRLQRADIGELYSLSRKAMHGLITAPWFQKLEDLEIWLNGEAAADAPQLLAELARLHTLRLHMSDPTAIGRLGSADGFPTLKRLRISATDLSGDTTQALKRAQISGLLELTLLNHRLSPNEFFQLAESSLFDNLQVLEFDKIHDEKALELVASRPCAAGLRVLKVYWSRFKTLAKTPLTVDDGFPSLTTLMLHHPFDPDDPYVGKEVKRKDTAKMLANLATPNLKYLQLRGCDFNDACADAIITNRAFANLRRLDIDGGKLKPKTAERMFRSENLRNLVELEICNCPIGNAVSVLDDQSAMPQLSECRIGLHRPTARAHYRADKQHG